MNTLRVKTQKWREDEWRNKHEMRIIRKGPKRWQCPDRAFPGFREEEGR